MENMMALTLPCFSLQDLPVAVEGGGPEPAQLHRVPQADWGVRGEELPLRPPLGPRRRRGGGHHPVGLRVPGTKVLSLLKGLRARVAMATGNGMLRPQCKVSDF